MRKKDGTMSDDEEPEMIWRLKWGLYQLKPEKEGGSPTWGAVIDNCKVDVVGDKVEATPEPVSMVRAAELLALQMTETVRALVTIGVEAAAALDVNSGSLDDVNQARAKLISKLMFDGMGAGQWTAETVAAVSMAMAAATEARRGG